MLFWITSSINRQNRYWPINICSLSLSLSLSLSHTHTHIHIYLCGSGNVRNIFSHSKRLQRQHQQQLLNGPRLSGEFPPRGTFTLCAAPVVSPVGRLRSPNTRSHLETLISFRKLDAQRYKCHFTQSRSLCVALLEWTISVCRGKSNTLQTDKRMFRVSADLNFQPVHVSNCPLEHSCLGEQVCAD